MFFKKSLIVFILLIIVLCCFNTVNALDNITESNDEPVLVENNGVVLNNGVVISDEVVYYNPVDTKEVNLSESECCSFIIQENGETIYQKYNDLIFEDICPNFRKVVIKSRENNKVLFMNQDGTPEFKSSEHIEIEKYIWYITLMNNEITLFSNGSYIYFDMKSDTAKFKGMEIFNYQEIKNKYFIYYKNRNNVLTINGDNLIFTKENPNKENQLFDFIDDIIK